MPDVPPHDVLRVQPTPAGAPLEDAVRATFGVAAIVIEVARQVAAGTPRPVGGDERHQSGRWLDAAMGAAWSAARIGVQGVAITRRVVSPVVGVVLEPPLVPRALHPGRPLDALARRWQQERAALAASALRSTRSAAPPTVEAATRMVDINRVLATAVDQVDFDALVGRVVARMDLTAAAEVALEGLDVEALAGAVIARVEIDPLVSRFVSEVDTVDAVARVMDQLPTDRLVAAVVAHLDMPALIGAALDQVDLTAIVLDSVDLGQVVNAALDELDITSIVMNRVDLALVATTVIDEIDLAGTIRDSSGSVASEAVRGVRMTSVDADRAVARLVDRLTLRRRARRLDAPGHPESLAEENPGAGDQ